MLLQKDDSFWVEKFTTFNKIPNICTDRRKPTLPKCDRAKSSKLKLSYQTAFPESQSD